MNLFVNEKTVKVKRDVTVFHVKNLYKKDADLIILNSFPIKEDQKLKEGDHIVLIKKGEIPSKEELESLLVSRHTPKVHEKIKKAYVGIAGLGGLGSNIALSLARIGIGKLLLVDYDVVEPSNLNRQNYFIKHIGMKKTDALKEMIHDINPFVEVTTKHLYLNEDNMADTFKEVDIVVEALDDAKYKAALVNEILHKNQYIVAASGMAGYFSNNIIQTKKIGEYLYIAGDEISEAKDRCGLMAPRVGIAANHQANTVLRIIMGQKEV